MDLLPWDVSPALTADRLHLIATTIARVRADARDGHLPEKGDNAWVFGCRAYARSCHALQGLSLTGDHPWLQVREEGLACTLLVEGEPLKFYRGEAESPNPRSLRRGLEAAIRQQKLMFFKDELNAEANGWFWLIALETHDDGSLMRAVVFQANSRKETRNLYAIPMDSPVPVVGIVAPEEREGVDLPPPVVGPPGGTLEKAGGDDQVRREKTRDDEDDDGETEPA